MKKNQEVQLTVIVPIYNAEKYLIKCIESIVKSTFHSYEVVLVDDGSTDDSGKLCDELSQIYPHIHAYHKKNEGSISARMYGIKQAKSKWITFIDADDWIDEDFLENMIKPIHKDDEIDIVIGSFVSDYDGFTKQNFGQAEEMYLLNEEALLIMFQRKLFNWSGCAKLYKKEMIMHMEPWWFDVDYGEDSEMNWKLFSMSKKIYYAPNKGYHYRINNNSMTRRLTNKAIMYGKRYREILSRIDSNNSQLQQAIMNVAYDHLRWIIKEFLKNENNYVDEITYLWEELRYYYKRIWFRDSEEYLDMKKWFALQYPDAKLKFSSNYIIMVEKIRRLRNQFNKMYIYGTGKVASDASDFMEKYGLEIDGYIVSKASEAKVFRRKRIYEITEINSNLSVGIILALNSVNAFQVSKKLTEWDQEQIVDLSSFRECLTRNTVI